MKKIVSTALVCAMLASTAVTSFAEAATLAADNDNLATYTNIKIEHKKVEGDDAVYFPLYLEQKDVTGATTEKVYIVDGDTDLANGKIDMNDIKDFDDLKLSVKVTAGQEYVESTDLDEIDDVEAGDHNGHYAVILNLKDYYAVDSINIKGTAKISKKTGSTISDYDFNYKIDNTKGMITVTEDNVTGENTKGIEVDGDEVTIDYSEFEGNVVNFKNGVNYLYLEGEYFGFDVKLSNQGKLAMKMDNDVNKAVSKKADGDADLTFFNFRGNPTFDFTGTMTFTLPEEDQEYFVYKIEKDNSLTKINAKLNSDEDALEFKTRTLGSYVLSDTELETSAPSEDEDKTDGSTDGSGSNSGSSEDENKGNPSTGSADFVGLAAALAVASAAGVGAVTLRGKKD